MKPLADVRVVEFATVGGVPFCGWWLAQQGAQVTRIHNPRPPELGVPVHAAADIGSWGRRELTLDLKTEAGRQGAFDAMAQADVLLEGFRPGVMERLGLGPQACHALNPALVYARVVGWDRAGPWAQRAGHDINYVAMSGALHAIGAQSVPLNLVGDLAGGALYAAMGILAALHARAASGQGCVVDTAMTRGCLHLLTAVFARLGVNAWQDAPASNVIDGGVPWYRCYMTADGRHMAVGAIEERFYLNFVQGLGLVPEALPPRHDAARHGELAACFQQRFLARTMAQWAAQFEAVDACVTPVLSLREAQSDPVNREAFAVSGAQYLPHAVPREVPHFTLFHKQETIHDDFHPPQTSGHPFTEHCCAIQRFCIGARAHYPSRPIHIIVPYSPGGIVDTIARVIGAKLGAKYGQTVIVENKSGAGGAIGDEFVAKSAPDGYTLLCASPGLSVLPSIVKGLSWSPVRDFRGVEGIGVIPNMFVVLPSMPANTLPELLSLAKKSSTPFTYATAGIGTTNHLSGLLLAQMAGVKLTAVHYRGQPDALNDLLAGRVTMMPLTTALAGPYVKAGKLRGLAVTATRAPAFPNIPTVAETANLPGYSVATWFGFVAPAKTPDAVVRKLSTDIAEILTMPDVISKFTTLSLELSPQSPKQFDAYIATETSKWSKVLKQDGIEPQ